MARLSAFQEAGALYDKLKRGVGKMTSPRIISPVPQTKQIKPSFSYLGNEVKRAVLRPLAGAQRFMESPMGNRVVSPVPNRNPLMQGLSNIGTTGRFLTDPKTRGTMITGMTSGVTRHIARPVNNFKTNLSLLTSPNENVRSKMALGIQQPSVGESPHTTRLRQLSANIAISGTGGVRDLRQGRERGGLQGALQTVRGLSRIAAPVSPLFQISNMASVYGGDKTSRIGSGVMKGLAFDQNVGTNVQAKNIGIKTPFGRVEADPAMMVGQMAGFVRNPQNKVLFGLSNKLLPSAGSLKRWLTVTPIRGAIEDIILAAPDAPENMSDAEKVKFWGQTALTGAAMEMGGQAIFQGGGKLSKVARDKLSVKAFDELVQMKNKMFGGKPPNSRDEVAQRIGQIVEDPRVSTGFRDKTTGRVSGGNVDEFVTGRKVRGFIPGVRKGTEIGSTTPQLLADAGAGGVGSLAGFEKDEEGKWGYNVGKGVVGATLGVGASRQLTGRQFRLGLSMEDVSNNRKTDSPSMKTQAKTSINTAESSHPQAVPSDDIIRNKTTEIQAKLQSVTGELEAAGAQRTAMDDFNSQFSPQDRQAIASMKRSMDAYERKGMDVTNVSSSPSYKKHLENVMEVLRTDSEDEALDFVRNYNGTKVNTKGPIMTTKALEKELTSLQQGVYKTPSGTVHYDPSVRGKTKLSQQKLAEADYREWSRALYKETVGQERTSTKDALGNIVSTIKTNTTSPLSKDVTKLKDISGFSGGFKDVYRNFQTVFGAKAQEAKRLFLDPFTDSKKAMFDETDVKIKNLETNIIDKYNFKPQSKESAAIQEFGEGIRDEKSLIEEFGVTKAKQIQEADTWFRKEYDALLDKVNQVRKRIYPNDPTKIIPKRKDYYRHFTEMSQGFQGLKAIFDTPAGISSSLSGISEYVRPRSKWLSFAQKRLGMKTDVDAIGGYLDYLKTAEYAIHVDPHTSRFRALADELAQQTEDGPNAGKLNNFIEFLQDFSNDLSGKTNPADRALQKYIPGGRKAFKALNWLNSRVKANVILGNLSSSVAQFFNIPQGVASAGPRYIVSGAGETLAGVMRGSKEMDKSSFIKERYFKSYDKFDVGMINNVKHFAAWITQVGDEIGTKYIWNMHHQKAITEGIADPIRFADHATRALVAGRGIGDVPLVQKSKVFQLVAPFQLEVANLWFVMKDFVDKKQFGKLATLFVSGYLMNKAAEKIRGSDVTFDPIQATLDALEAYNEEEDKKTGALRAGGRIAGEVLSNVPLGQSVAAIYPEYGGTIGDTKLPTRKDLFGEGDPTRFGSGLLSAKGLQDPLFKVLPPFGGAQIKKTIEGVQAVNRGHSESKAGKVQYPIEQTPQRYLQAGAFGKYSVPEAREYFKNDTSVLGDNQSATFQRFEGKEKTSYYKNVLDERKAKSEYTKVNDIKKEVVRAYLAKDISKAKELMAKNKVTITNKDVKSLQTSLKTKAVDAYLIGDIKGAKNIMKDYDISITNEDVQKKAKSKAVSNYKKYRDTKNEYYLQQTKELMEKYKFTITNSDVN